MPAISSTTGAKRILSISVIAHLPLTMLSIALLAHAEHLTGSFAAAGAVGAAYAIALGFGSPLLGRLVDRRGQTAVLVASSAVAGVLLGALALVPPGTAVAPLMALAVATGLATPPTGACLRALLPGLVPDRDAARALFAVDATAIELTWIVGPALALTIGMTWSTGVALVVAGIVLVAGSAAFAAEPASRAWRPDRGAAQRDAGAAAKSRGLRTLIGVMATTGMVFSAVQIGVAAATQELGSEGAAGPLLAVWGLGSLLGGIVATRMGGGARSATGVSLLLVALAIGHGSLVAVAGTTLGMGAALLLAGATIAPTEASLYAMVEHVVPESVLTEAFSWLATAAAVGASLGAAVGGVLVTAGGPVAAFAFAGAIGVVAVLISALRHVTLPGARVATA